MKCRELSRKSAELGRFDKKKHCSDYMLADRPRLALSGAIGDEFTEVHCRDIVILVGQVLVLLVTEPPRGTCRVPPRGGMRQRPDSAGVLRGTALTVCWLGVVLRVLDGGNF